MKLNIQIIIICWEKFFCNVPFFQNWIKAIFNMLLNYRKRAAIAEFILIKIYCANII